MVFIKNTVKLKNKIAIVTGSGRGIGKFIAKRFAAEGANVILISRTKSELDLTQKEIEKNNGNALSFQCDISKIEDVKNTIQLILNKFSKIDILVNNAGIITPISPIHKTNPTEWEENLKINLLGPYFFVHEVLPVMLKQNYGKILNLSGGGAFNNMANFSAYGASKAAIIRFTETIAEEVKNSNISINAIAPGAIKTKLTYDIFLNDASGIQKEQAKKVIENGGADIEKVCNLATFLATDESSGLSGKTISAQWDDIEYIKNNISEIMNSDKFTMNRIG